MGLEPGAHRVRDFGPMSSPPRRIAVLMSLCHALRGRTDGGGHPLQPRRFHRMGWDELLQMAFEQGVGPSLWEPLRAQSASLPPAVVARIRDEYRANAVRNLRFRRQLEEAVKALGAAGIVPLLFKGGLQLVDGTGSLGHRWMSDLDLAVPAESVPAACEALGALGYQRAPGNPFDHLNELPYMRTGMPGLLDLHIELGNGRVGAVLPAADAWAQSVPLELAGTRVHGLSATHQVLHNVLHAAIQDLNHAARGLPLRQLVALARLIEVHGPDLDWAEIDTRMAAHGLDRVLRDHLRLTDRLIGIAAPETLLDGFRAGLHERSVLASFALGWPAELQRNLRFAFGAAYLDFLYGHGNRRSRLAAARARHALRVVRRDGPATVQQAVLRRRI
jgi:hypothetical protein